jgi:HSP20 family protein
MAETESKIPVSTRAETPGRPTSTGEWAPFDSLRREVDRLFDDFDRGFWRVPFGRSMFDIAPLRRMATTKTPAVDVTETEGAYEIAAELPGLDEKNIEVKVADDMLSIKGEKKEEKEEKKKDYYLSERRYGAFERSFRLPDGVDADKIEASFKNGVLTVKLPKTPEAQKKEKKIAVKGG